MQVNRVLPSHDIGDGRAPLSGFVARHCYIIQDRNVSNRRTNIEERFEDQNRTQRRILTARSDTGGGCRWLQWSTGCKSAFKFEMRLWISKFGLSVPRLPTSAYSHWLTRFKSRDLLALNRSQRRPVRNFLTFLPPSVFVTILPPHPTIIQNR